METVYYVKAFDKWVNRTLQATALIKGWSWSSGKKIVRNDAPPYLYFRFDNKSISSCSVPFEAEGGFYIELSSEQLYYLLYNGTRPDPPPPLIIEGHLVEFKDDGDIKVSGATVPYILIKEIYERATHKRNQRS